MYCGQKFESINEACISPSAFILDLDSYVSVCCISQRKKDRSLLQGTDELNLETKGDERGRKDKEESVF